MVQSSKAEDGKKTLINMMRIFSFTCYENSSDVFLHPVEVNVWGHWPIIASKVLESYLFVFGNLK